MQPTPTTTRRAIAIILLLPLLVQATPANADTLSAGVFHIEYDPADLAVAQNSLDALERAAKEFEDRLPVGEEPVRVLICRDPKEFWRYAVRFGEGRVAGLAESDKGLIVLKSPYLQEPETDYTGVLRHELIHVLIRRNINMSHLPHWLNEGASMVLSGELRWSSAMHIGQMYMSGRIIDYPDLNPALETPRSETEFEDAYAQSLSMARFLVKRIGEDGFWRLLNALDANTFGEALAAQTSWKPRAFYEAWLASLWKLALISGIVSGFTLFQAAALLTIVAYVRKRRHGQQLIRKWIEAEKHGEVGPALDEEIDEDSVFPWEEEEEDEWR